MIINTNIYIFIFLFIVWLILSKIKPLPSLNENYHNAQFLLDLDKFYVSNKYITYFMVSLYFFFYSVIFLIFRIQLLGNSTLINFSIINVELLSVINFITFILNIILYLKILNLIFYIHIIKLHFYLYQKEWYSKLNDFLRDHRFIISHVIRTIKKVLFVNKTSKIFSKISLYSSRFIAYIPLHLVIISFIFDIYKGCLFYIYYTMLFYFLTNMIKKVRNFIYVKDVVYDNRIYRYFYQNSIKYISIKNWLFENSEKLQMDLNLLSEESENVLYGRNELITYVKNDFHVYYTLDPDRVNADTYLNARVKRIHILLLLFWGVLYYRYNTEKYSIILHGNLYINVSLILLLLFISCYFFDSKIVINKNGSKENKIAKNVFIFLVVLQASIILYIMLKNKLTMFPNELLLDWNFIKIIEDYSIQEKVIYVKKYLDNVISCKFQHNIEYWNNLREEIIQNIEITSEISLQDLRNLILSKINETINKPEAGFLQKIIEKIKTWFI